MAVTSSACAICGRPVDPREQLYREVVGFVRPRRGGGTNALRLEEDTGRVAHIVCVERGKWNVSSEQEALL